MLISTYMWTSAKNHMNRVQGPKNREQTSLTGVTASTSSHRVDGCWHGGWWVEKEVPILAALLLLMPASTQPRIPGALPPIEAVVRAVALMVMQRVWVARWRSVSGGGGSWRSEGGWRCGLVVVVVLPRGWRPLQWVSPGSSSLLQVVEPECQSCTVFQGGGGVDEGVGQELARLLQVMSMLDGVGQDAWQQAHVLTLGFNVARFKQRKVGEYKRDDALLWLTLPLADHSCRRQNTVSITKQQHPTHFNIAFSKESFCQSWWLYQYSCWYHTELSANQWPWLNRQDHSDDFRF